MPRPLVPSCCSGVNPAGRCIVAAQDPLAAYLPPASPAAAAAAAAAAVTTRCRRSAELRNDLLDVGIPAAAAAVSP
jgi:hypothetical protein